MMLAVLVISLVAFTWTCDGTGLSPENIDSNLDCDIRNLAWDYAKKLLPKYGTFQTVHDALQLQNCDTDPTLSKTYAYEPYRFQNREGEVKIFVDASSGSDSNPGDISHPLRTIRGAVELLRSQDNYPATVYLRKGTYYMQSALELYQEDSGLTISGYQDEQAVISGGRPYKFDWNPYNSKLYPDLKVFMADLSADPPPAPFAQLFINGRRAVRARYPNANPETMGLHTNPTGYFSTSDKWYPVEAVPGTLVVVQDPIRNGTHFPSFSIGIGGSVSVFHPPESYWGTASPTGGGGKTYSVPAAMQYPANVSFVKRSWAQPHTGELHAIQGARWGNWVFKIDERDEANRNLSWTKGGYQEARGATSGADWFVDNIFEELDSPGEFFYNADQKVLYFAQNGTTLPAEGIIPALDELIVVMGNQDQPVKNITITNVVLAHTATTYMASYEVPSGGDWSVHRAAAIFIEGAENILVQNCLFDSPGGNGLFLSNYVRQAVVKGNEFVWVGDNAIAVVGTADLIDGTQGNQPRKTQIIGNLVHEVGIFGKQVCAYVQSVACQTTLIGNVFFNGPRAGINFNDGFGGGNILENNLMFNFVRETGDHGVFNSWDRQPYITSVGFKNSLTPAETFITNNFFINNYHSTWPIDHDDGSCFYTDSYNLLVYGGYKNYLGHSKTITNNLYVYPDAAHEVDDMLGRYYSEPYCQNSLGSNSTYLPSGWGERWTNNTCVITSSTVYRNTACDPNHLNGLVPFTANNHFYTADGTVKIPCEGVTFNLEEYQAKGYDIGSTVDKLPSNDELITWGRKLLGL